MPTSEALAGPPGPGESTRPLYCEHSHSDTCSESNARMHSGTAPTSRSAITFDEYLVSEFWRRTDSIVGPNFIHPHPATPESTLLGVGGVLRGGGYKIPAAWASKYTPPPPPPEKCLLARNGGRGRGGGVYNFSLDQFSVKLRVHLSVDLYYHSPEHKKPKKVAQHSLFRPNICTYNTKSGWKNVGWAAVKEGRRQHL